MKPSTFAANKTYCAKNSVGLKDREVRVIKRTQCFVWIEGFGGYCKKLKIKIRLGREVVDFGFYHCYPDEILPTSTD